MDDEAGRRRRPPEALEEAVVAPALCQRPAEVGTVGLEDDAGVVVEVADRPQVEVHHLAEAMGPEQLMDPGKLLQGYLGAAVGDQAAGCLEDLGSAPEGREA